LEEDSVNKKLGLIIVILLLSAVVVGLVQSQKGRNQVARIDEPQKATPHTSHSTDLAPRVPAYQSVAETKSLGPTLAADQFIGKARAAYKAAKEIPATLAQLPCYCNCDRGYGHKSLHSCFEDDHASHCAVCVDEALLAYQLQTEQKMTPEQVRALIIEKYSEDN
jgi:hypothetical protein